MEDEMEPTLKDNLFFHVSLGYNLFVFGNQWWNHIDEHIILGAIPLSSKGHLETLTEYEKVKAIVTMNKMYELRPNIFGNPVTPKQWKEANVEQIFGSTKDFEPIQQHVIHKCADFINDKINQKKTLYIHCKAGKGRSTMVLMGFYIKYRNMNVDEAFNHIKKSRPQISIYSSQRKSLNDFNESIR